MNTKGTLTFLTLLISAILVNWLISSFSFQIDLTDEKRYTFSPYSSELLNDIDDKIFITIYLEGDLPPGFQKLKRSTKDLMEIIKKNSNNDFDYSFINPLEKSNEQDINSTYRQLIDYGLSPTSLQLRDANSHTNKIIFPGAIIYYKDRYLPVNFLKNNINLSAEENLNASIENLEYSFISTIQKIITNNPHKIAFLEGNGELDQKYVQDIINSTLNDNFDLSFNYKVDRFDIKSFPIDSLTQQVDIQGQINRISEYRLIIIANPTQKFNKLDKFIIDQYVMNGGRLLWLVDGSMVSLDSLRMTGSYVSNKNDLNIDDLLFKYGVRVNPDLVQDLRSSKIPIVTGYSAGIPQQSLFKWPYFPLISSRVKHPISRNLDAIKCEFVSSIDTIRNGIKKTILIETSDKSRQNYCPAKVSLQIIENPPDPSTYNKQHLPVAVLLEGEFESLFRNRLSPVNHIDIKDRSEETKMIVVSDGDLIANKVTNKNNPLPLGYDKFIDFTFPGNKLFLMNAVKYLCDNEALLMLQSKQIKLRLLDPKKIDNSRLFVQILNIFIPLLLLLMIGFYYNIYSPKLNYKK